MQRSRVQCCPRWTGAYGSTATASVVMAADFLVVCIDDVVLTCWQMVFMPARMSAPKTPSDCAFHKPLAGCFHTLAASRNPAHRVRLPRSVHTPTGLSDLPIPWSELFIVPDAPFLEFQRSRLWTPNALHGKLSTALVQVLSGPSPFSVPGSSHRLIEDQTPCASLCFGYGPPTFDLHIHRSHAAAACKPLIVRGASWRNQFSC